MPRSGATGDRSGDGFFPPFTTFTWGLGFALLAAYALARHDIQCKASSRGRRSAGPGTRASPADLLGKARPDSVDRLRGGPDRHPGQGVWEYVARQHEADIEKEYAAASTPDKLKAFAAAHPDHSLAGIALLIAADEAYAADKIPEAQTEYSQAAAAIKTGPLAARAQLGLAMTEIQSGQAPAGTAELKRLADDTQGFSAIRAEAAFHLASLAAAAGNSADVQKLVTQIMQIDPSGPWTQRAFSLQASIPPPPQVQAPAPSAPPSISVPSAPSR